MTARRKPNSTYPMPDIRFYLLMVPESNAPSGRWSLSRNLSPAGKIMFVSSNAILALPDKTASAVAAASVRRSGAVQRSTPIVLSARHPFLNPQAPVQLPQTFYEPRVSSSLVVAGKRIWVS